MNLRDTVCCCFLLCALGLPVRSQSILVDMRADDHVMLFLDELNNLRQTNATFITQPFTRAEVASILNSLDTATTSLNRRQRQELQFYKAEFLKDGSSDQRPVLKDWYTNPFLGSTRFKQPDLFYYHTAKTTVTVNPIIGITLMSNQNGTNWQRRIGGDFQAYIGKIGLYGSVRDVSEADLLSSDSLLTPQEGGLYKLNPDGGGEFSEARGGITYGGDWGYIGLVRDHVSWGYGYYGRNIFDINTAPFAQVKLHLNPVEWFQFDYFHGSLQSDVVDSSTVSVINDVTTFDYHNKYMAANMLSLRPLKALWVSIGNSIIYSSRNPEPTFFIPVMFFKSADHYLNRRTNEAGGNAQMFAALSARPVKKLHVYSTLFVDEVSFSRMFDQATHTNWFSIKSGFRLSNILPNTTLTFEHIRSNAMVYKHFIQTTDYTNSGYVFGHYLRDNAREFIVALHFKPWRWLTLEGNFQYAEKGPDIADDRTLRDPATGILLIQGIEYLETKKWIQSIYSFSATSQLTYRMNVSAGVDWIRRPVADPAYQVPFYDGNTTTLRFSWHYGF